MSILKELILLFVMLFNLYFMYSVFLLGELSLIDSVEWFAMANIIFLQFSDGQKLFWSYLNDLQ